jgi:arginase family enzyme
MAEPGGIANAISVFRGLGLAERLAKLGVGDEGDLALKRPSGVRGPSDLLNEAALDHLVETTHTTVHSIRDRGRIPLMIGGDCPVLLGGLASIGPRTGSGLLMVDGHEDAWPPPLSETGECWTKPLEIRRVLSSEDLVGSCALIPSPSHFASNAPCVTVIGVCLDPVHRSWSCSSYG